MELREIRQEELKEILLKHQLWLDGEDGGKRANLAGANLVDANLERAYLVGANLAGANLVGAYLERANLVDANLVDAYLEHANLKGANLERANLERANLAGANLERAILVDANLERAYLVGANLERANLAGANLVGAYLERANLKRAYLDYSCLPLWCGSLRAHFDDRQLKQIAYHLVKAGLQSDNASEETKAELVKLIDFANGFHRMCECGFITYPDKEGAKYE